MNRRAGIGTSALVLVVIVVGVMGAAVIASQTLETSQTASASQVSRMSQTTQTSQVNSTITTVTYTCDTSTGSNGTNGPSCVPPPPSVQPPATTSTATMEQCYADAMPVNASNGAYDTVVYNITKEFGSWNWTQLSSFTVGSYTFVTTNPGANPNVIQLEPQLFTTVTNSQGITQRISVTDLGGWNGQPWPPDMSLQQTLFGGDVTIQWLFLCNSTSVFLEVNAQ